MIPPRTILAAVNFSSASRTALVLAARLARHCRAELHVLHVEHPLLDTAAERTGIGPGETRAALRRFIVDAWPAAVCSPHTHVAAGEPVDVILGVAHEQRADLVVVSSCHKSGLKRLVFGSTTETLLRRADVSVLVAPAEWAPPDPDARDLSGIGPLVVAVNHADDLSNASEQAVRRLAAVLNTPLEIVDVVTDPHRLTETTMPGSRHASMLVLNRTARGSWRTTSKALTYRALAAATMPILMQVADQIAGL